MFHLFGMIREKGVIIISKVKEVYQFDLDDNFVAKYASQSEASRQTGISQGNIGQALKDTRTQSGGYKWQYQMN